MKTLWKILIVLVFGLFSTVPIYASTMIDLSNGGFPLGGTMVRAGDNVAGSGIGLDSMIILGAPQNNGAYDLSGAFPFGNGDSAAVLDFDTGIASNFIRITGGVPAMGIPMGTTLLEGTITSWSVFGGGGDPILSIGEIVGPDVKSSLILDFIGLPSDFPFNISNGVSTALLQDGQYIVAAADILDTGKVPEPITMLLLGSGLLSLVGLRRKFRK